MKFAVRKYSLYLILMLLFSSCTVEMPDQVTNALDNLPDEIDFNFHVRPILSDRCYACHGPDEEARKADLRLDLPGEAKKAIAGGNLNRSALVHRILSDDPEEMMPPPESNLELTNHERAILIKWIKQGAQWKDHWAFESPVAEEPPSVDNPDWPHRNEIDRFIHNKLQQQGMAPNPEAGKEQLLRRVTMDLTGLPPTIKEIEDFLTDSNEDAYEKVVDRLLQSDACAERLAMDWMDLSRYADSHGMHADGWRMMWPWRDWVIQAFDKNMPYNEFVTHQLAGDLIPNATRDLKLATAFNRNHPMTAEGGVIDEEFRLNYVFDRVETVGTAFLGLTLNCARCHDHKFDPVTQKDYYQLTAFFNNIKELGMTGDDGNYGPMLPLMDGETERILEHLTSKIEKTNLKLDSATNQLLETAPEDLRIDHMVPGDRLGYYPLETLRKQTRADLEKPNEKKGPLKSLVVDNNRHTVTPGDPELVSGKVGKGLKFRGEYDEMYIHNIPNYEWTAPFSGGMWVNTTKKEKGKTQTLMGTAGQKNNFWRGWELYLDESNRLNFRLIHSLPHNYIQVTSLDSLQLDQWRQVFFTYDGTGKAKGVKLYLDGTEARVKIAYDQLYKTIKTIDYGAHKPVDRAVMVAKSYRAFTGENGVFKGVLDEIELYGTDLTALEVASSYQKAVGNSPVKDMSSASKSHWINQQPQIRAYREVLQELRNQWLETMDSVPEVMVMEEMAQPRTAYAYKRGAYNNPMYEVTPGTPGVLNDFSQDLPRNRLGLATWLFSGENPLTARVTVNRYWQMLFGNGLVKTPQDFGVQGALPTHPKLLDWLAVYFRDNQWDVKGLLKIMVMSHTYRQSSSIEGEKLKNDPLNIWLSRGASYRLSAEMIRDNALAASGLLVQQVGGQSVRPYQPEGLWIDKGNFSIKLLRYKVTHGDSLYRRSLYTFVKRTSPHPAMTAFDAPNRDICIVKRETTNTPLQALVLMNDPQFVECSRVLAQRVQQEGGDTVVDQISLAFQLVTGRKPKKDEIEIFGDLYDSQLARFMQDPKHVDELLAVGEYPMDQGLNKAKTAALTMVASTMINHDEAYMKR